MSRILITSLGSYGDVYPYVCLALALQARGHRPLLATSEYYRAFVEGRGLAFQPLGPAIDLNDRAAIARVMDPKTGSEAIIKGMLMPTPAEIAEIVRAEGGAAAAAAAVETVLPAANR